MIEVARHSFSFTPIDPKNDDPTLPVLNERIVREGWALDFRRYSPDYLQAEAEARRAGAGMWWRGEFELPWEWRAEHR